jgi:hypothetical protein
MPLFTFSHRDTLDSFDEGLLNCYLGPQGRLHRALSLWLEGLLA